MKCNLVAQLLSGFGVEDAHFHTYEGEALGRRRGVTAVSWNMPPGDTPVTPPNLEPVMTEVSNNRTQQLASQLADSPRHHPYTTTDPT